MAGTASKTPFLRAIAKRGFAVNVRPRPVGQTADIESTVLANKVVVASANGSLPISRVSVVFRAGSRNESYENQGAAHMLRIAASLSTKNSTGFAITRNIQQAGGALTATSDREIVAYTVETTANNIETGLKFLQDVIEPAFKPWELEDSIARIKGQVAAVTPQDRAVELVHKAAFRTGLGNSVYIPEYQIGKLSSESLLHYAANNLVASRCAVVGIGIDQNTLCGFAQNLQLGTGGGKTDSAKYYGGDARKDTAGQTAHVVVAGQGGALASQKETLAFAVLEYAVGAKPVTKRGNTKGTFGKALSNGVGSDVSVSYAPLNVSYTDAGLFGFRVSTDTKHIGKAVESLTSALKSGSVSADDVTRGKAQLKTAVLESYSVDSRVIKELGVWSVLTKQAQSVDNMIAAIDSVSPKDVQEAAKKAGSSKLSVGAVGNLANVPYASDLA